MKNPSSTPPATPDSPEPVPMEWINIAIGGGGFVTGLRYHPREKGLVWLRTDVGGAYRRQEGEAGWTPVTDHLTPAEWNLQGIESMAVHPEDPDRIWLAAGTYTHSRAGNGAVLRSRDRGHTWQASPLPFGLGGNEAGRNSGERLVVDPAHPSRLWLGTRRKGIWESLDSGETWHALEGFPVLPDGSGGQETAGGRWNFLAQAVGVTCIVFDPDSAGPGGCTRAWAALSRHGRGLFETTDGGSTWQEMPGQPELPLRPIALERGPDGTLWCAFGKDPGPNHMGPGSLWRRDPDHADWTCVTPGSTGDTAEWGIGAVSPDPQDPSRVYCASWYRGPGEEIFVSTDRGATWTGLLEHASWNHDSAPWTRIHRPHWICCLAMDPFRPQRLTFPTGYGIWTCTDTRPGASGGTTEWHFDDRGIEETVPLALLSPASGPEGPRLLSGVGDIDGFIHRDFRTSPAERFDQPGFKNTECLAAAGRNPRRLVRSGTTYRADRIHAAWSDDAGETWHAFVTQPPDPPGTDRPAMGGPVCLSADGETAIWAPWGSPPWRTGDHGRSWQECRGLDHHMAVLAHPADPAIFRAWDTRAGTLMESTDGGHSFAPLQAKMPVLPLPPGHRGTDPGDLRFLDAAGDWMGHTFGGVLHLSEDRGRTFAEAPGLRAGLFCSGAALPGRRNATLYAAGSGTDGRPGILRSCDRGRTWEALDTEGHGFPTLRLMEGDPLLPGRLYLGTGGRGIFAGIPRLRAPETASSAP